MASLTLTASLTLGFGRFSLPSMHFDEGIIGPLNNPRELRKARALQLSWNGIDKGLHKMKKVLLFSPIRCMSSASV
jgi:hypothetical protein